MTKELLEQYLDICDEIQDIREEKKIPVTDVVSGSEKSYPFTKHSISITGLPQNYEEKKLEKLLTQKNEIEQFISSIPSSKERRILYFRIQKGLSWKTVAAKLGWRCSEENSRKIYQKILEKYL